ncbi:MAG TPA: hypothetical protein VGP62_03355 [Bryobacteraceae bacterium]|nr:hypothetical protein [Bryobacteraceae bacterium]
MIDLFEAARQLQVFCDQQGWRFCFIGGLAVQRWGEPRVTRDVDLTYLRASGLKDTATPREWSSATRTNSIGLISEITCGC